MKSLLALGLGIFGLTLFALYLLIPWKEAEGASHLLPALITVLAVTVLVYFAAVRVVLRQVLSRHAIWIVLIVAAAIRLPVLFTPPILSSDIYRYVWDGRVQLAGVNPYLHVPADPALAELRDEAIYPHINRAGYARTIYPPAAQIVFAAIARVTQTIIGGKAFMVGFEAVAMLCALRLLTLARLPPERVLIYAWNPLTVWSFACDGHVDALGIALLSGALLLRCLKRDAMAGIVFAAAALVKFLPAVVAPALWRRHGGWPFAAACMAAVLALYACYAGAGWRVLGYLPGYRAEEGLVDGSGIWMLAGLQRFIALPADAAAIYGAVALLTLACIGLWIMTRPRPAPGSPEDVIMVCGHAAILATCVTVIISPHYTWYFAWLALPAVVRPWRAVVWLSTAPVLLYHDPLNDPFLWRSMVYVPAAILAVGDVRRAQSLRPGLLPSSVKGTS